MQKISDIRKCNYSNLDFEVLNIDRWRQRNAPKVFANGKAGGRFSAGKIPPPEGGTTFPASLPDPVRANGKSWSVGLKAERVGRRFADVQPKRTFFSIFQPSFGLGNETEDRGPFPDVVRTTPTAKIFRKFYPLNETVIPNHNSSCNARYANQTRPTITRTNKSSRFLCIFTVYVNDL